MQCIKSAYKACSLLSLSEAKTGSVGSKLQQGALPTCRPDPLPRSAFAGRSLRVPKGIAAFFATGRSWPHVITQAASQPQDDDLPLEDEDLGASPAPASEPAPLPKRTSRSSARPSNLRKASLAKATQSDELAEAPQRTPEQAKKFAILQQTFAEINKKHGDNTIQLLRRRGAPPPTIEVIPTGSLGLDAALGVGGLPLGRIVEIYGPEASGKTTLALHVIAEAQKRGGNCVYVDMEHALDVAYAEAIGVDPYNLAMVQPNSGEQALEIADTAIRSHAMSVVVIDSVASLVPQAELEMEYGEPPMARQARLLNQALRKLTPSVASSKTLLIFINQLRHKLNTFGSFGAPAETTPGGNGLKFQASIRIDIRKIGTLKKGEEVIGSTVRVKVTKNKVAAPHCKAEFDIDNGNGPDGNKGIAKVSELIDLAVQYEVLGKSGPWFKYKNENLGQGKDKVKELLAAQPELYSEIMGQVREYVTNKKARPQPAVARGRALLPGDEFGDEGMDDVGSDE